MKIRMYKHIDDLAELSQKTRKTAMEPAAHTAKLRPLHECLENEYPDKKIMGKLSLHQASSQTLYSKYIIFQDI